jgi:phage-related protein (TIGR01555 family)
MVMSKAVHRTRLLTFVAREVPDLFKPTYMFGGQSLTQMMKPVVENWLSTRAAIGEIIKRFTHNVVKFNVTADLNSGNAAKIFKRVQLFNELKGNFGTLLLDTTEDFINVSIPLGSLDQLQAQAQEHMCSLARIPQIKLLGIQPAGLNSTSEGELRSFEDMIHAYQESFFRPNLKTVFDLVQLSLFGQVDPDIGFEFQPLFQLQAAEAGPLVQSLMSNVVSAFESGLFDRSTGLKAIKEISENIGPMIGFGNVITDDLIDEAESEPPTPSPEEMKGHAAIIKAESDAKNADKPQPQSGDKTAAKKAVA